jgi:amidohydrolase
MTTILQDSDAIARGLTDLYQDLHKHPELSQAEHRTAKIVAERLIEMGVEVLEGVGNTGVVGITRNGDGPTVLVRADMDGLPVLEQTGLDYASTARGTDPDGNDVPVMHACGHDIHITCLLGATELLLARRDSWQGTLVVLFQPAEEDGTGARGMVEDGLYDRIPRPDIVLGQHVAPAPAGVVGVHAGPAFSGADSFEVTLFGRGGHGSRPETTIDPVVLAAATIMRLQTVVSREIAATETAVVTVGQVHSGTKNNIIADEATLGLSIRSASEPVRKRVIAAVHRIIKAEADGSGAEREPEIIAKESFPVLVNDVDATKRTVAAFHEAFGEGRVLDPGTVTGSEDVGVLATAAGAPLVYWLLGGVDAAEFQAAAESGTVEGSIPSNHSPFFAPVIHPTIGTGVAALTVAALAWLAPAAAQSGP